jgi:ubiquinone biosynthesis protein
MGFLQKDYRRVAEVHFEAGYVPQGQDVEAFAQALRSVGEPIFGVEAKQISMARLLAHLFDVTERFGMATRTELLLLQRSMVVVEGVSRSLDSNINMWETARPVVENYIKQNLGPKAFLNDTIKTIRALSRYGPHLPFLIEKSLHGALNQDILPVRRHRLTALLGGLILGGFLGCICTILFVMTGG